MLKASSLPVLALVMLWGGGKSGYGDPTKVRYLQGITVLYYLRGPEKLYLSEALNYFAKLSLLVPWAQRHLHFLLAWRGQVWSQERFSWGKWGAEDIMIYQTFPGMWHLHRSAVTYAHFCVTTEMAMLDLVENYCWPSIELQPLALLTALRTEPRVSHIQDQTISWSRFPAISGRYIHACAPASPLTMLDCLWEFAFLSGILQLGWIIHRKNLFPGCWFCHVPRFVVDCLNKSKGGTHLRVTLMGLFCKGPKKELITYPLSIHIHNDSVGSEQIVMRMS